MDNITFLSLMQTDICINDISCVEYNWKNSITNEYPCGRDQNILSFTMGGTKKLFLPKNGEIVFEAFGASVFFIAKNTPYITEAVVKNKFETGYTVCIKFGLTDKFGNEIILSDKYLMWDNVNVELYRLWFQKIMNDYMPLHPDLFKIKSTVYRLLDELSCSMKELVHMQEGYDDLLPALMYLENNLKDNISTDALAKMCYMSTDHFRRRFKAYTGGVCFTDYKNRLRIEKAQELLENPMWSISLISEALGFYDTAHFYRVYKKYTGSTPVSYKKLRNEKNKLRGQK